MLRCSIEPGKEAKEYLKKSEGEKFLAQILSPMWRFMFSGIESIAHSRSSSINFSLFRSNLKALKRHKSTFSSINCDAHAVSLNAFIYLFFLLYDFEINKFFLVRFYRSQREREQHQSTVNYAIPLVMRHYFIYKGTDTSTSHLNFLYHFYDDFRYILFLSFVSCFLVRTERTSATWIDLSPVNVDARLSRSFIYSSRNVERNILRRFNVFTAP